MNKKTLTVIALVIFVATLTLIFVMPLISRPAADTGTCCSEQTSTCVIGSQVVKDAYYKESGSCG